MSGGNEYACCALNQIFVQELQKVQWRQMASWVLWRANPELEFKGKMFTKASWAQSATLGTGKAEL
jgi:hypothetical protein